ncbi:LOW QUALITY PROTEIN: programmed cell death protein 2-like [Paramacrobiotus metropolitanus]|uniref:LOW QUALITY PROTEIN: programmed cell death protein 2-like n=1 Tax=Paramacrobiotus metropolitanus TaxID=2943436 RepID=UPI002445FFE5|nr:LOW QUALITY PROTEIN: programmed cell death protein 2-like [Paramacrobiotus metropolitanus]
MTAKAKSSVELGFAEEVPTWKLHHRYFPSKIGGFPAWLDLHSLPAPRDLQCPVCSEPTSFLLQMYATENDANAQNFHRTIFVFACRKTACTTPGLSKSFIVLRCGLPRVNSMYSDEPPAEDPAAADPLIKHPLCAVCGCLAPNTCASCKKSFYCSRSHQILAWKNGHKEECEKIRGDATIQRGEPVRNSAVTFAEYEIVAESEEAQDPPNTTKSDQEKASEYKNAVEKLKPELNDVGVDELETFCARTKDKVFQQFRKRVAAYPTQVLRYQRDGVPLLISSKNPPPEESRLPPCAVCRNSRRFEFQIMPQLLNYLQQEESLTEGLDFGTVMVYTCPLNCRGERESYVREVAWVQCVDGEGEVRPEVNGDEDSGLILLVNLILIGEIIFSCLFFTSSADLFKQYGGKGEASLVIKIKSAKGFQHCCYYPYL